MTQYYFIEEKEAYKNYLYGFSFTLALFSLVINYLLYKINFIGSLETTLVIFTLFLMTIICLILLTIELGYSKILFLTISDKTSMWIEDNTVSKEMYEEWYEDSIEWNTLKEMREEKENE